MMISACLWGTSVSGADDLKADLEKNRLPEEVLKALHTPGKAILYSLEPGDRPTAKDEVFHRYKVLGKTTLDAGKSVQAAQAFEDAVKGWDGNIAMCFNPRHGLRITLGVDHYDLLLCYECHQIYLYKGNKLLVGLGAAGSPKVLNDLLTAAQVKLAYSEPPEEVEKRAKKVQDDRARWKAAMPASLGAIWNDPTSPFEQLRDDEDKKLKAETAALAKQFPRTEDQILALYAWFGSGAGPWSGFPGYETEAESLLMTYALADLVSAAQHSDLTEAQTEGAARLFGGWEFGSKREKDQAQLPADLKKKLLEHCLKIAKDNNKDRTDRARSAFGKKGQR